MWATCDFSLDILPSLDRDICAKELAIHSKWLDLAEQALLFEGVLNETSAVRAHPPQ